MMTATVKPRIDENDLGWLKPTRIWLYRAISAARSSPVTVNAGWLSSYAFAANGPLVAGNSGRQRLRVY